MAGVSVLAGWTLAVLAVFQVAGWVLAAARWDGAVRRRAAARKGRGR